MEAILLSFNRGLAPIRALLDCQILYNGENVPRSVASPGFQAN